jgi:hypothetical protein
VNIRWAKIWSGCYILSRRAKNIPVREEWSSVMPLIALWASNRTAIDEFTIEQVVATSGDGNLKDASLCSLELRAYLSEITSSKLTRYIEHCLSQHFSKGGMVLQDLVNELGRRLDYKVTNGRYQGTSNAIGYDGIWTSPEGHTIVVEVKTTDAYRISLDTIANYREKLVTKDEVVPPSSILMVVGREDTGELEAQVRGSRHAWDIRLISADALIKLVQLKEDADAPDTGRKIRSLLAPMEYTRLDQMIDVMFTAAKDVESAAGAATAIEIEEPSELAPDNINKTENSKGAWVFTDAALLQAKREVIIGALSSREKVNLIKRTRALYWDAGHTVRVACTISKRYAKPRTYPYWYAYHPPWDEFLAEGQRAFFVLGCMDLEVAFAVPWNILHPVLEGLGTTQKDDYFYWHINLTEPETGKLALIIPKHDYCLVPWGIYSSSNNLKQNGGTRPALGPPSSGAKRSSGVTRVRKRVRRSPTATTFYPSTISRPTA